MHKGSQLVLLTRIDSICLVINWLIYIQPLHQQRHCKLQFVCDLIVKLLPFFPIALLVIVFQAYPSSLHMRLFRITLKMVLDSCERCLKFVKGLKWYQVIFWLEVNFYNLCKLLINKADLLSSQVKLLWNFFLDLLQPDSETLL